MNFESNIGAYRVTCNQKVFFSDGCVLLNLTRRGWLASAGAALAVSCGRRSYSGFPGYLLVATAGENSVSAVDLADFRLLRQIPLGGAPTTVLADSSAHASYILTPGTGAIHALDSQLEHVASRRLADQLFGLQSSPGRRLFTLAPLTNELLEVDHRSLDAVHRWKLSAPPFSLDVSASGSAAVSTGPGGTVELVDGQTGKQFRRDFAGPLGHVRFRADGEILLVANQQEQALTALRVPDLEIIVHLPLAMQPQNLCFNADGGQLFITGKGLDGVAIAFPYRPLEIEQTVLAGRDPGAMACSENPAYLFVASASGADVCVLNVDNRKMIGLVEVGQKPSFIIVTPDSQYALVLNERSADLAVIHIASLQENSVIPEKRRAKSGAALFTMLPVGERPVQAAIVRKLA